MTLTWCSLFFFFFILQVSHFLSRSLVAEGPLPQSWVMYGSLIVIHCDYAWVSCGKYVSPPQLYESLYGLFAAAVAAAALLSWIQTANSFNVCRVKDKTCAEQQIDCRFWCISVGFPTGSNQYFYCQCIQRQRCLPFWAFSCICWIGILKKSKHGRGGREEIKILQSGILLTKFWRILERLSITFARHFFSTNKPGKCGYINNVFRPKRGKIIQYSSTKKAIKIQNTAGGEGAPAERGP